MDRNGFGVTSIFKIIIRICMNNVEFFRKTSKVFIKRCLFIFSIFYLNEKDNIKNSKRERKAKT